MAFWGNPRRPPTDWSQHQGNMSHPTYYPCLIPQGFGYRIPVVTHGLLPAVPHRVLTQKPKFQNVNPNVLPAVPPLGVWRGDWTDAPDSCLDSPPQGLPPTPDWLPCMWMLPKPAWLPCMWMLCMVTALPASTHLFIPSFIRPFIHPSTQSVGQSLGWSVIQSLNMCLAPGSGIYSPA